MKKIVVFTGAGISKESGIDTFRDAKDGMWENFNIEEVASIKGWQNDPEKVLEFYNARRSQLPTVHPNKAHRLLAELENYYDVTIVTQNVDDLHERAGSSKIYHLHGELTKAKGSARTGRPGYDITESVDIQYNEIKLGDVAEDNSQMRPDIVWFGEYPHYVDRSYQAMRNADILLIIGTSLQITYTLPMLASVSNECINIYIDPSPSKDLTDSGMTIEYVEKSAVEGLTLVAEKLIAEAIKEAEEKED